MVLSFKLRPGLKNCLFGTAYSGFYLVGRSVSFFKKITMRPKIRPKTSRFYRTVRFTLGRVDAIGFKLTRASVLWCINTGITEPILWEGIIYSRPS